MFFLSAAAILHVFRQKPERLCELATEKEVPQGGNYSPFISVFPATTSFLCTNKPLISASSPSLRTFLSQQYQQQQQSSQQQQRPVYLFPSATPAGSDVTARCVFSSPSHTHTHTLLHTGWANEKDNKWAAFDQPCVFFFFFTLLLIEWSPEVMQNAAVPAVAAWRCQSPHLRPDELLLRCYNKLFSF